MSSGFIFWMWYTCSYSYLYQSRTNSKKEITEQKEYINSSSKQMWIKLHIWRWEIRESSTSGRNRISGTNKWHHRCAAEELCAKNRRWWCLRIKLSDVGKTKGTHRILSQNEHGWYLLQQFCEVSQHKPHYRDWKYLWEKRK